MSRKLRIICFLLAALMVFPFAACGKGNDTPEPSGSEPSAGQEQTADSVVSKAETGGNDGGAQAAEPAKLTGALSVIEADDRDPSVLRGVRITGNRAGSDEDINGKEPSLTDVRCIFELNEWVDFYPDIDAEHELRVWVLEHRGDQAYYRDCTFDEQMPGFASYCDLRYPADEEDPGEYPWGSFYLSPDEHEAGCYDLVFTCEGKAIAALLTRFYGEEELSGLSGSELEALMHE